MTVITGKRLPSKLWERSKTAIVLWDLRASRKDAIDISCSPQSGTIISSSDTCQKIEGTYLALVK